MKFPKRIKRTEQACIESFWMRVNKDGPGGCWLWMGCVDRDGYGLLGMINGKNARAHRYAFELKVRKIPTGMQVLHKCDNPTCCNPKHLMLGTSMDNMRDMVIKRRSTIGERHPNARLRLKDIRKIFSMKASGKFLQRQIAHKMGICNQHVSDILNGKSWGRAL